MPGRWPSQAVGPTMIRLQRCASTRCKSRSRPYRSSEHRPRRGRPAGHHDPRLSSRRMAPPGSARWRHAPHRGSRGRRRRSRARSGDARPRAAGPARRCSARRGCARRARSRRGPAGRRRGRDDQDQSRGGRGLRCLAETARSPEGIAREWESPRLVDRIRANGALDVSTASCPRAGLATSLRREGSRPYRGDSAGGIVRAHGRGFIGRGGGAVKPRCRPGQPGERR